MLNHKQIPLKTKEVTETGEFAGYGSVFGNTDSYGDIVMPGAFTKTLGERGAAGVSMLWQHNPSEPLGVYTSMKEDDDGLYVEGRLLIDEDPLAKRAHAHLKAGSLSGLSIGYITVDEEYDKERGAFLLKELDLWEVSLVTFPANDEARVDAVKSLDRALKTGEAPDKRTVERVLRDVGFSARQAKAMIADGYDGLLSVTDDEDVEGLKTSIAELMRSTLNG